MNFQLVTPCVTRTGFKLSPVRQNSKKQLSSKMTENDLLLLNLPEVPFVEEGERLNRSCPFDFDADDSDSEEEVEAFHETWAPHKASFLQPRNSLCVSPHKWQKIENLHNRYNFHNIKDQPKY